MIDTEQLKRDFHELFEIMRQQEELMRAARDSIFDALTLIRERLVDFENNKQDGLS